MNNKDDFLNDVQVFVEEAKLGKVNRLVMNYLLTLLDEPVRIAEFIKVHFTEEEIEKIFAVPTAVNRLLNGNNAVKILGRPGILELVKFHAKFLKVVVNYNNIKKYGSTEVFI